MLHHELPIHKAGTELVSIAVRVQEQMPRGVKRFLGEKICAHSMEMVDSMAMANATRGAERLAHIETVLKHQRAMTMLMRVSLNGRYVSHKLWGQSVQLLDGTWLPGRSICFVVTRPKPREVWAADFRDRVVHHLLYNRISPRFHAAFAAASSACIPGRGTLYAERRLEHLPAGETFAVGNSYLGLLRQASHGHADRAQLANALRRRGHCVAADLTKAYRRSGA